MCENVFDVQGDCTDIIWLLSVELNCNLMDFVGRKSLLVTNSKWDPALTINCDES